MELIYTLLASFAVMLVSLSGVLFAGRTLQAWAERNLKYLTSIATGVFLVVVYNLVTEVGESHLNSSTSIGLVIIGLLVALVLNKLIPDSHHHHGSGEEPHGHSRAGAHRILLSDSLHNITDGFLLAAAFAVDVRLGLLTALGVVVHEAAQEISEYFVYKSAGFTTKEALVKNFLSASTIILGALGGYFVLSISEDLVSGLLALALGIILYTIVRDLIPNSIRNAHSEKTYLMHILAIAFGVLMILGVNQIAGDTHIHSGSSDEHGHESEQEHMEDHDHEDAHGADEDHANEGEANKTESNSDKMETPVSTNPVVEDLHTEEDLHGH